MRILFVYPNITRQRSPQMGIMMISAVAKGLGHELDIFDLTVIPEGEEISRFQSKLSSFKPDMLAVSVRSNEWSFVKKLFESANTEAIIKVFGGPHATVSPEEVIEIADIVVLGEGEETFSELLRKIENKEDIINIAGSWVKQRDKIFKNPMRELIFDLDSLPFPNWEIMDKVHYYQHYTIENLVKAKVVGTFEGSRGCPFACSYCTNDYIRSLYKDIARVPWRREKSPERLIEEIKRFKDAYGLGAVYFIDEILLTKKERIKEFRDLYRSQINVPFFFMERPENMTEEKVRLIGEAGALNIAIGIESGDEGLRRNLLNRRHSNETIISAFRMAHKYRIKTHAFTMIGFPGESRNSIDKTYQIVKKAKPDTVQTTIFFPLKHTKLYDLMVQNGLINSDIEMPQNYYETQDSDLLKYQFLISYYYLPPLFLKIFLSIQKHNILVRIFFNFLKIVRNYRYGGISLVIFSILNTFRRKFRI